MPAKVKESASETPEAEALVMVKLLSWWPVPVPLTVTVWAPDPSNVTVPEECVKVEEEFKVKLPAILNVPEFDAIKVASAELVKLPEISIVGSLVLAVIDTSLVPSPFV
ncbi:MAG: hypothetical protein BWY19_00193 [bacterium ADurb.Bin212]|nr:MAG: hypothetical protein BWY19_00193 [bacterium ADurb.Bin212]